MPDADRSLTRWSNVCMLSIKIVSIVMLIAGMLYLVVAGANLAVVGAVFFEEERQATISVIIYALVVFVLFFATGIVGMWATGTRQRLHYIITALLSAGLAAALIAGIATPSLNFEGSAFGAGIIMDLNAVFGVIAILSCALDIYAIVTGSYRAASDGYGAEGYSDAVDEAYPQPQQDDGYGVPAAEQYEYGGAAGDDAMVAEDAPEDAAGADSTVVLDASALAAQDEATSALADEGHADEAFAAEETLVEEADQPGASADEYGQDEAEEEEPAMIGKHTAAAVVARAAQRASVGEPQQPVQQRVTLPPDSTLAFITAFQQSSSTAQARAQSPSQSAPAPQPYAQPVQPQAPVSAPVAPAADPATTRPVYQTPVPAPAVPEPVQPRRRPSDSYAPGSVPVPRVARTAMNVTLEPGAPAPTTGAQIEGEEEGGTAAPRRAGVPLSQSGALDNTADIGDVEWVDFGSDMPGLDDEEERGGIFGRRRSHKR